MTCCRCNRTGRCQNCCCVKKKRPCTNCLPDRLGKCINSNPKPRSSNIPDVPAVSRVEADHTNVCHSHHGDTSSTTGSPHPGPSPATDRDGLTQSTGIPELPAFTPMALPRFTWGELDSETFTQRLNHAYSTVVHWRRNIFSIPSGNAGAGFVTELSRLFRAYAVGSALESVALKAAMTMCALLLQKPSRSSKAKDHVACLERCMATCKAGDLNELLEEGLTIQR